MSGLPAHVDLESGAPTLYPTAVQTDATTNSNYGTQGPMKHDVEANAAVVSAAMGLKAPSKDEATYFTDQYITDSNVSIRLAFIQKVYCVVLLQLAVTIGFIALGCFHTGYQRFMSGFFKLGASGFFGWLLLTFWMFAPIIPLLALHKYKGIYPHNVILMSIFTLMMSQVVSIVGMAYNPVTILYAGLITFAITIGITIYVFITKKDFSFMGGALYGSLVGFIVVGFIASFFPVNSYFALAMSYLGALLFMAFILYDTSNILLNHSVDDWIPAAIALYLDIINLFLKLLGTRR